MTRNTIFTRLMIFYLSLGLQEILWKKIVSLTFTSVGRLATQGHIGFRSASRLRCVSFRI